MSYHRYSPEIASRFLKRLEGTEGNMKAAIESLGLVDATIRSWRLRHPEFDRECREVVEKVRGYEAKRQ